MFTANFPRRVIETRFPFQLDNMDWLISIVDCAGWPIEPANQFEAVFTFDFNDCEGHEDGAMTPTQAREMSAIIARARALRKNVWVHCTAGMCRSGAVVEVLHMLGWDIVEDFSPQRIPNEHVFNILRLQFPELRQGWEEGEWLDWALDKSV